MNPQMMHFIEGVGAFLLLAAIGGIFGWRFLRNSTDPPRLLLKWIITAGLIGGTVWILPRYPERFWPFVVMIPAMVIGVMWAPSVGSIVSSPFTNAIDGGDTELEPQPFYSIAETKRRNGHPREAIAAIREQLEKFPGDFRGTMMLASILVQDMNDLPGAQLTLERWMEDKNSTPHGKASALTAIADWQLQYAQDPEAAGAALRRIIDELPNTPAAHQAEQRLAHLPSLADLVATKSAVRMVIKPGIKDAGLRPDFKAPTAAVADPDALAAEYVQQLEMHPADTATREKLAVLYAEQFQRLDLATDQLEQLISLQNETPKHVVQWLNLMADLQIRVGKDVAGAEATLRRILERFSTPAIVDPTLSRLASLGAEMKAGRQGTLKTLGHYEKNLGLK